MFKRKDSKILHLLYPILFVVCFFQAMNIIPPGLPGEGVFIWPFRLLMLYLGCKAVKSNKNRLPIFNMYLIYYLMSFIFYVLNDYPLNLYVIEIGFFLPAVLFVYIGMERKETSDIFYKTTLAAIIIFFVVGLYLYFLQPSWYQSALVRRKEADWFTKGMNITYDHIAENIRFSSFMLTSYATEYFGIFSLPISLLFMARENDSKKKLMYVISVLITLVCIVLSMQRAAMLSAFLVILFYVAYDCTHNRRGAKLYIFSAIVISFLVTSYMTTDVGIRVIERFGEMNVDDAFNESRVNQNQTAFQSVNNIILGSGVGTCGGAARRLGLPAVSDSNYMKMLFEQGIIGVLMFFTLIIKTLLRVKTNYKYLFAEGAIVASYLIAMIGSNALSFSLFSPLFWFAIGRIWNDEYLYDLKARGLHI